MHPPSSQPPGLDTIDPPPVFVGGTGRSGTTVCARLLGTHSRYHMIPIEIRFHATPGGLSDVLDDPSRLETFLSRMRSRWFIRKLEDGSARGLHRLFEWEILDRALTSFERRFPQDAEGAGRSLMQSLLLPLVEKAGKLSWVEMTPPNIEQAGTINRLFPEARFIHMTRDGRDVACSVKQMPWAPEPLLHRLDWWAAALKAARAGASEVPRDRILTLSLEDLVRDNREESYERLLAFLELEDELPMRGFFESMVTPERAHVGRWRNDVGHEAEMFISRYQELVEQFTREAPGPP